MNKITKNLQTKNQTLMWAVIVLLVIANAFTLFLFKINKSDKSCLANYSFINPRYACGRTDVVDKKEYVDLKARLSDFIDRGKSTKKIDAIGVWFRDLNAGPTFGINSDMDFIPASLLKLPLAITFYDLAENGNPDILQKTITYTGTAAEVPTQIFKPENPIQLGNSYTIEELIDHSLTHSDNVAAQLLYEYLENNYKGNDPLLQTYRNLGILQTGTSLDVAAVNTKEYGAIFRLLYNTSLLDVDSSEKILSLLAKSEFQDGLRKGVPESIVVAHKFGERFLENGQKQLHDCGIIYYPGNPYELCVMTRGSNYDDLKATIAEISKEVYEEFDSRSLLE